ncbi:tRNA1(Val) (adenine(37)-N6)-methyltransferase [Pseudoleptotrichia goodfellowii]|uniref:Methyltransferase small domain protein n=1 Tax=Pseudoleptotrichia goodfellowii F0264 TaxID=596323 RepID=D0GJU4_9FUSO|nr:tRNA1(Val) (adenine(37)-N6)-methyltransferase [Pseudoleptotrichia goodfellowii]EEY35652.1 methyltransferase small domain protein [Pseudoleptotrichia goodfellowii F0264]
MDVIKKIGEETTTVIKRMKIIQRNDFQNFTLDTVLLADFTKINRKTKKVLDIGTGCGIIPILLAEKSKAEIVGIELQKEMADIAERNVQNYEERINIINDDIKNYQKIFKKDEFDCIVTNPPYFEFKGDINQINNSPQMSLARHNIDLTLEQIIKISAWLLKNSGHFSIVFRSERLVEMLKLLTENKLEPKRMRNCYTKRNQDAKICLIEAIKDADKGLKIEMPIYVYEENGEKTEYIKKLYE